MKSSYAFALSISLLITTSAGFAAKPVNGNLPRVPTKPVIKAPAQEVPLGTIMLWWGARSWINPTNTPKWQICNGDPIRPNSDLGKWGIRTVPNLEGKFPMGAPSDITALPTIPEGAGSNKISGASTNGTPLTKDQMPKHSHNGRVGLDHTHATNTDYFWNEGGGGGMRMILRDTYGNPQGAPSASGSYVGHGGVPSPGHRDTSGSEQRPQDFNYSIVGPTSAQSDPQTPAALSFTISEDGAGKEHSHSLPEIDTTPQYVNVFYIIRINN